MVRGMTHFRTLSNAVFRIFLDAKIFWQYFTWWPNDFESLTVSPFNKDSKNDRLREFFNWSINCPHQFMVPFEIDTLSTLRNFELFLKIVGASSWRYELLIETFLITYTTFPMLVIYFFVLQIDHLTREFSIKPCGKRFEPAAQAWRKLLKTRWTFPHTSLVSNKSEHFVKQENKISSLSQ